MTDRIHDQISAFIDNELPAEQSALLVRRFERDPEARARAMRYTLIGAALRGELLEPHPSVLRQRVAAALSGAPPVTPRVRERWPTRFARPALGVGIAATVAVAAIGLLRTVNETSLAPARGVPLAAAPSQVSDTIEPPSYVVPQEVAGAPTVTPPIRLTNYLMHHGEYASGLTRTSVHSNVVGAATKLPVAEAAVSKPLAVDERVE